MSSEAKSCEFADWVPRHVIMITGPQWLPRGYFEEHYEARIRNAVDPDTKFILGAADGIDAFAQELLAELCPERVCIYNKDNKDGRKSAQFSLRNGFLSYGDRDLAMIQHSTDVICILPQYGGGTTAALLPFLSQRFAGTAPAIGTILHSIRVVTEEWDETVLRDTIVPLYKKLYPAKATAKTAVEAVQPETITTAKADD